VIGVDLVPERLELARRYGVEVIDWNDEADPVAEVLETTSGRGADSVIDAVGMEAHGAPVVQAMQAVVGKLPSRVGAKLMETVGSDRTTVLHAAIDTVRRGGTISLIGVYGGAATPMPMMDLFDKQIQLRMGQANVKAWIDELLFRSSPATPTLSGPRTSRRISCRSPRHQTPMRCSKRSRTERSRSCSSLDGTAARSRLAGVQRLRAALGRCAPTALLPSCSLHQLCSRHEILGVRFGVWRALAHEPVARGMWSRSDQGDPERRDPPARRLTDGR
jgi:hypothetical protein